MVKNINITFKASTDKAIKAFKKFSRASIRVIILVAAHKTGIKNANQFGDLAVKIGACSKRHAQDFYAGNFDMSTKKADIFLKHFKLKIK